MNFLRWSSGWRRTHAIFGAFAFAGVALAWCFAGPVPATAQRRLRIGFEENPPLQTRSGNGFSGLSVETVSEAAKRAGVELEWIETGTSSEEALRKGLVDLWPLMVDLPDRRTFVHFARPWMHSSYVLLLRQRTETPARDFKGDIAVFKMPLHVRMLHERFPEARILESSEVHGVITQVCTGAAEAAFFEMRVAQGELQRRPAECDSVGLRVHTITDIRMEAGVASTFAAAEAADRIQSEIGNMFRDGTLAVLIAKYSYFGLDDTFASYERVESEARWRWLTFAAIGVIFAAGVWLWLVNSLRQRQRVEAALRESEARFRILANTAPVMIAASGPDGQATFFNKIWLDFTGRPMEQELGGGWLECVHPEDRERTMKEYSACFASRGNCKIEYRLRRADGEYRNMMCSGVSRYEPDGVFAGYIASCIDLTDIRSAQVEASERQNLESLGVLAGGIAHDFNNLLGGTLAYAELAQMKLGEGSSPDDELLQIREVAIRGSEIVRQLMIFAGKERGTLEPLDVSSLVSEILELLKVSISKHAVLQTSLGKDLPTIRGNAAQIQQVVMNLVTNASEAMGDRDGVIRVVTDRVHLSSGPNGLEPKDLPEGEYLRLEVSDNGSGMTLETQRKAFDPFFTTKFAGRGMGLAVVQQIVRGLGGAIQVESSLGIGTSIQIILPCTAETCPVNGSHGSVSPVFREFQPLTGITILVVEDEEALLAAVSKMLHRRGCSVIQARDGSSALEFIQTHPDRIDAMLLDVTLPGLPSRQVFEEAERLRPDLVAILTSAYSRESVTSSFAGLRVASFIRKPFHVDELVTLLQDRLTTRSSSV